MVDFGGFYMPIQYTSIIEEHNAVRDHAGIFDVSHMGQVTITGKDASSFINYLLTNDIEAVADNRIMYSPMCYEDGGCVDDILVYKINSDKLMLITNASNTDKDFEWINKNKQGFDVKVENLSGTMGVVAFQGPKAVEILQKFTDLDLDKMGFFTFVEDVSVCGVKAMVSRNGYTGEDGFEIYTKAEDIEKVFMSLLDASAKPCGLGARDTLRFESALPLYGNELSKDIDPLSAGLKFFVKMDKKDFIGKKALESILESDDKKALAGLEMIDRGVPRTGYEVYNEDDQKVGYVTSGSFCPSLDKTCALALVDASYAKSGQNLFVEVRNKKLKAVTVKKPFYNKKYKK